jgi:hypothetical protein
MATRQITVERFSVISSKSFQAVLSAIEAKTGRPDISSLFGRSPPREPNVKWKRSFTARLDRRT